MALAVLADNHSNSEHIQYGSLSMFYTKQELVVSATIEISLAIVGTFGNCIVCVAVLKNRSLQMASNFYMVSLAIADLLVTTILVPTRTSQHLAFLIGTAIQDPVVDVLGFVGRTTILASISSPAALSNDRHAPLKHPLKYRTALRYDKERAVRIILSIWLFSLAFTCVPLIPVVEDEVFLVGFASFVAVVFIHSFFSLMVISCVSCGSLPVGESSARRRICVRTRREIHLASPFKMNVQRRKKSLTL